MAALTRIRLERRDDGIRILTLNDPDKRNAIGPEMREDLLSIAQELRDDAEARCLIVTGEGSSFCAGADLVALFGEGERTPSESRERQLAYYESFLWIRSLPYPTVAAVNGHAIGAGLNLALVCDIVVGGPNARFGATFSKIGLHPGGGCTYFVTERLGRSRGLRTLLTGEVVRGERAYELGFADQYDENPLDAAVALGTEIAALEPALARDIKRAVTIATEGGFLETITVESWAQAASTFHPGVMEGILRSGRTTAR